MVSRSFSFLLCPRKASAWTSYLPARPRKKELRWLCEALDQRDILHPPRLFFCLLQGLGDDDGGDDEGKTNKEASEISSSRQSSSSSSLFISFSSRIRLLRLVLPTKNLPLLYLHMAVPFFEESKSETVHCPLLPSCAGRSVSMSRRRPGGRRSLCPPCLLTEVLQKLLFCSS